MLRRTISCVAGGVLVMSYASLGIGQTSTDPHLTLPATLPAVQLQAAGNASKPVNSGRAVAVVNGETITEGDVQGVIRLLPAPPGQPTETQHVAMRREALEMLIDDALMRQYLTQHGRPVDSREVDGRLAELTAALQAQNRTLADFLRDTSQSEAHLRLDIAKKIQWDDLIRGHLTEANLRKYFEENRDYYDQVAVRASHILVRVSSSAPLSQRQAAQQMLTALRQRIVTGELDFAEAARKYSQCSSAPQGGDIGYFPRKWAVDERIAQAAFSMKVGELSGVIQSDYGFHLVKVTDRKPGHAADFDRVKEQVQENYAADLWQAILAQQRRSAQIQVDGN